MYKNGKILRDAFFVCIGRKKKGGIPGCIRKRNEENGGVFYTYKLLYLLLRIFFFYPILVHSLGLYWKIFRLHMYGAFVTGEFFKGQ